jgi:predicted alpha/beta-hydrolase family hydrolase
MPAAAQTPRVIPTPGGDAHAHISLAPGAPPSAALVLGHGAGGGVAAPDLQAARRAAVEAGLAVAMIEQPYRVAGRRSPPAAPRLDEAWTAVIDWLLDHELRGYALVTGGRSSGARVACRTAPATGSIAVLCLAFPLQPPARAASDRVSPSRQPELDCAGVPVLVVQGNNDRFGMPASDPSRRREVVQVEGDHGLKRQPGVIGEVIARWLGELSWP